MLGPPVPNSPHSLCGRETTLKTLLRICVKEEVDVPVSLSLILVINSPYGLCGRQTTLKTLLRNCVKEEVDVPVSLSLVVRTVCVDVKQH